jgi:hypothetical protein
MLSFPRIREKRLPVLLIALLTLDACGRGTKYETFGPPGKPDAQILADADRCNKMPYNGPSRDPAIFINCMTASGNTLQDSNGRIYAPTQNNYVPLPPYVPRATSNQTQLYQNPPSSKFPADCSRDQDTKQYCDVLNLACLFTREIALGVASHVWSDEQTNSHLRSCIQRGLNDRERTLSRLRKDE